MDRKDLGSSFEIRERNAHRPVESTGTREGGVEDVSSVGRGNHDDLVGGVEAIHLHQNRVERLFPFIMPTRGGPATPATTDGVDFVEEDDAGRILFGLLEEVADPAGADADEHLDKV